MRSRLADRFGNLTISWSSSFSRHFEETHGFAPLPRDSFAFISAIFLRKTDPKLRPTSLVSKRCYLLEPSGLACLGL